MKRNMLKQTGQALTALLLTAALSLSCVAPALAYDGNQEKQEVVYASLDMDGSVSQVYVVNIFDQKKAGQIIDYGNYSALRNMTTDDKIDYADGTVKINAKAGKLYYQGTRNSTELPWTFGLRYYLDGTEQTAEELAGKSGKLKISMSVRQNAHCNSAFFDNFALQATFVLDTNQAENILAEGATTANVGANKQLTYTILPGKETDITIQADVTDFEMSEVSINGLPLSLNVEVDDQELMDQVTELLEAIEKLDDGAAELKDGAAELQDGTEHDLQSGVKDLDDGANQLHEGAGDLQDGGDALKDGVSDLQDGAGALNDGLKSLNGGVAQIQAGLEALNGQSASLTEGSAQVKDALEQIQTALSGVSASADDIQKLADASSQIREGIDTLTAGVEELQNNVSFKAYKAVMKENGLDVDALKKGNTEAIKTLHSLLDELDSKAPLLESMGISGTLISMIKGQATELGEQLVTLLEGNNANIDGMEAYLNAVSENIGTLAQGAASLRENYAAFDDAIGQLADTLSGMLYQMSALSGGIDTLVEQYETLDSGINEYTQGVAEILAGYSQVSEGTSALVKGSGALKDGSDELYSGTSDLLKGIAQFYDATGTLRDGTGELDEGVADLLAGIVALYDGTAELKDGTGEMREETSGMDTEISDKMDRLLESISGSTEDIPSFVSEKNTNVQSVQFVIKTGAIKIPEAEEREASEGEALTFWEKLLQLFQ